ncbi:hypothetical protein NQZ68_029372 [Dissostichus eleginoides]|nr:hypothetical protein NQZ68_029372 [Dissostichus eleginoides]
MGSPQRVVQQSNGASSRPVCQSVSSLARSLARSLSLANHPHCPSQPGSVASGHSLWVSVSTLALPSSSPPNGFTAGWMALHCLTRYMWEIETEKGKWLRVRKTERDLLICP